MPTWTPPTGRLTILYTISSGSKSVMGMALSKPQVLDALVQRHG